MKLIITIFIFITIANAQNSSGIDTTWVRHYASELKLHDWDAKSMASDLAVDNAGNVYVTGSDVDSVTHDDYATIKYDASGIEQWVVRYNGPGNDSDFAHALAIDGAGNVYVTGTSVGSGTSTDYATIKYDASGVEQWVARYNGPGKWYDPGSGRDRARAITIDEAGNVYVTGSSVGSVTHDDYATIKYDASGIEQWVVRYNGPGNYFDFAHALTIDGAGNVYVTGQSEGSEPSGSRDDDYATIKYDSSGVEQWIARYDNNYSDYARAIAIDGAGNVYVTGESEGLETNTDYATIKYDALGIEQWVARCNGSGDGYDYVHALVIDEVGNVYVTGQIVYSGTGNDYATIKYDSSGVEQWIARYDNNYSDYAYALAVDNAGNVYVTGKSWGTDTRTDYATIKYDPSGIEQWVARYNGPLNDTDDACALAIDDVGNVYVTGTSDLEYGGRFTTIKYTETGTTIPDHRSDILLKEFSMAQNHPNPFNPSTTIEFTLPKSDYVELKIYNILGKEVTTLVSGKLNSGNHTFQFDGSNLASGIYLYRVEAGVYSQVKKMILLR